MEPYRRFAELSVYHLHSVLCRMPLRADHRAFSLSVMRTTAPARGVVSSLAAWCVQYDRRHPAGPTARVWLAQALGISDASVSRIVRGLTMPRARTALRIQELTGVSLAALVQARARITPANRAARVRQGQRWITRGSALVTAALES